MSIGNKQTNRYTDPVLEVALPEVGHLKMSELYIYHFIYTQLILNYKEPMKMYCVIGLSNVIGASIRRSAKNASGLYMCKSVTVSLE